ncbi:MAG: hypothetical protein JEY94_08300 [Melioribacteraceae bacterium]|nr:hypothetical protein [Melioribacteraceae bacterium]
MNINFFEPLSKAISRMTISLFKPFDMSKWFVFGFTAFLAGLLESPGGNYSNAFNHDDYSRSDFWNGPLNAWEWLNDNPFWFIMIGIGVLIIIAIIIALVWLSSRGAFMFLANVVTDETEVSRPWYQYKKEGNSVFIWRLVFGLITTIIISVFVVFALIIVFSLSAGDFTALATISSIILLGIPFLIVIVIFSYISMFMNNFVIPIMYKERISAVHAWGRFMYLFKKNAGSFILYGLLLLCLNIAVGISIMMIGLFTCCIGFIFLIIPYISTIVLLPVIYTYRVFSLEFLEQFGNEYKLLAEKETNEKL